MKVKVKKLHPDAVIPEYATPGSSGFDLVSIENVELYPGDTRAIRTGLAMDVGRGYELQVRPRSGMSLKTPLRVSNAPGTVDASYRGEVMVLMSNTAFPKKNSFGNWDKGVDIQRIKKGDRIAQGVIQAVKQATFKEVKSLNETERGCGGFGSTGR